MVILENNIQILYSVITYLVYISICTYVYILQQLMKDQGVLYRNVWKEEWERENDRFVYFLLFFIFYYFYNAKKEMKKE